MKLLKNIHFQILVGLVLSAVLLVGIKFTTSFGCLVIVGYVFVVGMMIFSQLLYFKTQMEKFVCSSYFKDGSLLRKICVSKKIYVIVAFFLAIMLSFSLLIFVFLADEYMIGWLFLDVFIIYFLYVVFNKSLQTQLEENAHRVFAEMLVNALNMGIVIVGVLFLSFINVHDVQFSPKIFYVVHDEVNHACKWFRWYLRTKVLIGYSIDSLRNIGELGTIIYSFLVVTSISFFPITALTLYYKFFIRKLSLLRREK